MNYKEKIITLLDNKELSQEQKVKLEEIFPELKESEDDRIRQWIIDDIRYNMNNEPLNNSKYKIQAEKAIAWLEKQGGYSIHNVPSREVILAIWDLGNEWKELTNGSISTEYGTQLDYIQKHWKESEYSLKVKQSKQEEPQVYETKDGEVITYSETNGYKFVEPKFNVGDWIACEELNTARIINIDDDRYEVEFIDGSKGSPHIDYVDRIFHLWTIKDAKHGDVLVYKGDVKHSDGIKYERICLFNNLNNAFFTLTKTSNYTEYDIDVNIDYPDNTVPATKKQKELLFMAMKGADYEWNDERKSLRQVFNCMRNDVDYFVRYAESFVKEHEQKPQRMISAEAKEALFDYENANIQQKDSAPKVKPKFTVGDCV